MPVAPLIFGIGTLIAVTLGFAFRAVLYLFKRFPVFSTSALLVLLSIPIVKALIINGGFWGWVFALLMTAGNIATAPWIAHLVRSRKPRVEDDIKALMASLSNSVHLKDFYAPAKEYLDADGIINEKDRAKTVDAYVVEAIKRDTAVLSYLVTFRVTVDPAKLQKILTDLQHEQGWAEIRKDASYDEGGYYRVIIIPSQANNPLYSAPLDAADFYRSFPMSERSWANIAVGLNADAQTVYLPVSQTLVAGTTGSGKGSAFNAILAHYLVAPKGELSFFDQNLVTFYGVDPKYSELEMYTNAHFLETLYDGNRAFKVAVNEQEVALAIAAVNERMEQRILYLQGRSFEPSESSPLIILMIDELLAAMQDMSKETISLLKSILVKGRSKGVYVFGFSQEVTKEALKLRDNFSTKVALRLSKIADASTLFGQEASDLDAQGVHPERIESPSAANSYRTAGLAYLFNGITNSYEMLRFFYTDDELMEAISKMYSPESSGTDLPPLKEGTIL